MRSLSKKHTVANQENKPFFLFTVDDPPPTRSTNLRPLAVSSPSPPTYLAHRYVRAARSTSSRVGDPAEATAAAGTVVVVDPAAAVAAAANVAATGGAGTTAETATAIVTVTAGTMVIATGTAAGGTRATGPPGTGAAVVEGTATETGTVTGVEGSAETMDGELFCNAWGVGCLLLRGRNRWRPVSL